MASKTKAKNTNKMIIIFGLIIIVIILVAVIYKFVMNRDTVKEGETAIVNDDYNARLQAIQTKIDEQEQKIQKMNDEMVPLLEQRSELEQQLFEVNQEQAEDMQINPEEEDISTMHDGQLIDNTENPEEENPESGETEE